MGQRATGNRYQAVQQGRALHEGLSCFPCRMQPWLSKVSCFWLRLLITWCSVSQRVLPHTLCDREKQDRYFLRIIQSTPSTMIPSLQNPCSQKEGGFLPLLVARGSLATRPLLPSEHCWQGSGYKIQRGHGVANDFFEQVYS